MNNDHHYRYRIILAVLALCQAIAVYDVPLLLMQHEHSGMSFPVMPSNEDRWV